MSQGCCKDVLGVHQGSFKGVSRVFQGVSMVFQRFSSVFPECFKDVVCYKEVSSMFQGGYARSISRLFLDK